MTAEHRSPATATMCGSRRDESDEPDLVRVVRHDRHDTADRAEGAADPLAHFRDLSHPARRRDHEGGVIIAEGTYVIDRMLASPMLPTEFLGTAKGLQRLLELPAREVARGATFHLVDEDVLADIVGFRFHRHLIAVAPRPRPLSVEEAVDRAGTPRVVVVLEGLNDHENIGSIYRNAAGLGAGAVLLGAGCADPLYRRSVRVSMGHALRIPTGLFPGTSTTWQRDLDVLRERGYRVIALTPSASQDLAEVMAEEPARVALLVGAEGPGLTEHALRAADVRARIPMGAGVDSLNVATATAVALYEVQRTVARRDQD